MSRVVAVVLAAGSSRRFGTSDKLVGSIAGRPLLAWTLDALGSLQPGDRLVVVGGGSTQAARLAQGHGCRVVFAPDAARGMRASLHAGLLALEAEADVTGALVVLGDDPLAARDIAVVRSTARDVPDRIVAVRREDRVPHPVYLPRATWPAAGASDDADHGLRSLVRQAGTTWVAPSILRTLDVDRPGDAARLAARLSGG